MPREQFLRFYDNLTVAEEKEFVSLMDNSLDLDNPKTFNEKLKWIMINYRDPLMTLCADKYAVREYIKQKIGEQYLVPLLGVWDNAEDIDFDKLPNQFVLKVNWGSGQNIIVKDKSTLNIKDAVKKLNGWTKWSSNHYYYCREWVYKDIPPKIIAEQYLNEFEDFLPVDYKLFCFNGEPKIIMMVTGRGDAEHRRSFYSLPDWEMLPMKYSRPPYPQHEQPLPKPEKIDELIRLSKIISADFPHVRADWYVLGDKIYFGELTFYHEAGNSVYEPEEWNTKMGDMLNLPKPKR